MLPLAGGVVGQAGSQMRGPWGRSEAAHVGAAVEVFPPARRSNGGEIPARLHASAGSKRQEVTF